VRSLLFQICGMELLDLDEWAAIGRELLTHKGPGPHDSATKTRFLTCFEVIEGSKIGALRRPSAQSLG